MQTVRVGAVEEFEDRGKRVVTIGDVEIGIFRLGDEFHAWHNICPHQGGPVCQGRLYNLVRENLDEATMQSHGRLYDEDKLNIVCPWHGLEFDIRTGEHPGNSELALERATVQVDAGEVYVLL
jgi:nitrite reductase/ring-hydroxylating ferredoxin subunit